MINQATIKAGVEAAKKGIPMAGQKLADFFSKEGIEVKIKRVSDTGRHKVVDAECSGGNIKILANSTTIIPSGSAHITFDQKYTYAYGDNWIIE